MTNIAHNRDSDVISAVAPPVKRVIGRPFLPGNVANPGGRPKGLAAYVREATQDGRSAVDLAVRIMAGDVSATSGSRMSISPELQLDAAKWLIDRGFGKSVSPVEITGLDGGPIQRIDLTVLAATDLDHLEAILSRSSGGNAQTLDSERYSAPTEHNVDDSGQNEQ